MGEIRMEEKKRKHGPIGKAGLVRHYQNNKEDYRTIKESDFSFNGDRMIFRKSVQKGGID